MPMQFWSKDGKIIVDAQGRPILCDRCPCGGCPAIPAGSVIEFEFSRTFSRTMHKEMHVVADPTQAPSTDEVSDLAVVLAQSISTVLTTTEDMPDDYERIFLVPEGVSRTTTIVSSSASTEFTQDSVHFIDTAHAVAGPASFSRAYVSHAVSGGECAWSYQNFLNDLCYYANGNSTTRVAVYEWVADQTIRGVDTFPIVTGYGQEWDPLTFAKTVSGAQSLPDENYYHDAIVSLETISPWEGSASMSVSVEVSASYDRTDPNFGTRYHGSGTETVTDTMTAHWLITPPTPLRCATCGL